MYNESFLTATAIVIIIVTLLIFVLRSPLPAYS